MFGIMFLSVGDGYVRLQGTISVEEDYVILDGAGVYAKVPRRVCLIEKEGDDEYIIVHVSPSSGGA